MKLEPRRVEAFLGNPGAARAALFYGDDVGLIRERANQLVRSLAGSLDDAFRIAEIDAASTLPAEMASAPLSGGRRVVRVRDASDAFAGVVEAALASAGAGFLVLEGPGLATRSKLRAVVERATDAAAIGCYPPDARSREADIRGMLGKAQVIADRDAIDWLVAHLGAGYANTSAEIAKLACYVGAGGRVDLDVARRCIEDQANLSLDDALFAATAGDTVGADRALALALGEGVVPVAALRAALFHLQRLTRACLQVASGAGLSDAMRAVRPPVFFRQQPAFRVAIGLWSPHALGAASKSCWEAEKACKRTGAPAEQLCRYAIGRIAQRATMLHDGRNARA